MIEVILTVPQERFEESGGRICSINKKSSMDERKGRRISYIGGGFASSGGKRKALSNDNVLGFTASRYRLLVQPYRR